ncbi:MAG: 23S rRNA (adenine(2503)-C(2))-methyltransferase RlmN [Chloroflexi bacterium]|nr:23S rRNA (adenine(2503)-C(2))-methyltransferase RlmN [Chloroflexota bacterium]
MRDFFRAQGERDYRVAQVERWIYREGVNDFDAMTNLPVELRVRLKAYAQISNPTVVHEIKSADGLTRKSLLRLADGETIETVLMLYDDAPRGRNVSPIRLYKRKTVCISTQVGCPIKCPFCATGQAGYIRNLTVGEIVAQVLHYARVAGALTNVVVMGMGEPFMQFDVTWRALETLCDPKRFALSARRITVSTSGEIPGIEKMARAKSQINLAVSLHAADDELRNVLVPLNRKYPLRALMRAVKAYSARTHRRVTFEYALMDNVNDQLEHARALAQMVKGMLCHVNLIPLNPTATEKFRRSPYARVKSFQKILQDAGIPTTLRVEKGIEIAAGCGMLRQHESPRHS